MMPRPYCEVEPQIISLSSSPEIAAVSWTGGKDCNLALLKAWRDPALSVKYLICFRPEGKPFRSHPILIMEAQADALGLPLLHIIIPSSTSDYMEAYVNGLKSLKMKHGINVVVTGDMDLVGTMQRNWIERCCEQVIDGDGKYMKAYLPLWKAERSDCLHSLLEEEFVIIFSCVKSPFFDGSWIGRRLNEETLLELKTLAETPLKEENIKEGVKPLDLCGERGEYHTMCLNGPLYRKSVFLDDFVHAEPLVFKEEGTKWKGNIHNANIFWTLAVKDNND